MTRVTGNRQASCSDVTSAAGELRAAARAAGVTRPRVREDGTIIVHSRDAGYRAIARFAVAAADIVGTYVHVISDDVPAARIDAPSLCPQTRRERPERHTRHAFGHRRSRPRT